MILGLKENIPYVIKSVPETKISGTLLEEELEKCIRTLQILDFNIRGVVCDNHASNVATFRSLSSSYGRENDFL